MFSKQELPEPSKGTILAARRNAAPRLLQLFSPHPDNACLAIVVSLSCILARRIASLDAITENSLTIISHDIVMMLGAILLCCATVAFLTTVRIATDIAVSIWFKALSIALLLLILFATFAGVNAGIDALGRLG